MELHESPCGFHGTQWSSMEFHGASMELHVIPWSFHGTPWGFHTINSMEFHETPWSSMEFHGVPWNSMELFYTGNPSPWYCQHLTHSHSSGSHGQLFNGSFLLRPHQHGFCTHLGSKEQRTQSAMLMSPNKDKSAAHGCHCPNDYGCAHA